MNTSKETVTINHSETLFTFINNVEQSDNASMLAAQTNDVAQNALNVLCKQYEKLQNGKSKNKNPAAGEMPFNMALTIIDRLYDAVEGRKITRESFQDRQVKLIKQALFEKVLPKKVAVLTANQMIDKYEKELKAAKAVAEKALRDADDATEKEKQAQAQETQVKKQAAQTVAQAVETGDAETVTESILDTTRQVKQAAQTVAQASKTATQADKTATQAKAKVTQAQTKLDNAKAKQAAKPASAGKADNNQQKPKLNFMTANFSKDCKEEAARMLAEIEADYKPSKPEMLMLAKLILDKYNN